MRSGLAFCVAFSVLSLCGGRDAAAAEKISYVVRGSEAPTYVIAGGKGSAQLLINEKSGAKDAAVSVLVLMPGTAIPTHKHEGASELLFIQSGRVEMVVAGKTYPAGPGDAVYLPAKVEHSAKVVSRFEPLKAVQIYVGPGPEQRFAKGERLTGR